MEADIIFLVASFLAASAATVAGFGSSTLMIPVAFYFMDPKTAIFLVACFHLFNNLFKVKAFWKKIDWPTVVMFGGPSILLAFLGAALVSELPIVLIKQCAGGFLVLFSVYSFMNPQAGIKNKQINSFIGGTLSGFLAGLIGLGGAVRAAFLVTFNLPKEVYVATAAFIAMIVDCTRIPTYLLTDVVQDESVYRLLPFLLGTAYAGVRVGKLLLNKISQTLFKRVVLIALILVGLKLMVG